MPPSDGHSLQGAQIKNVAGIVLLLVTAVAIAVAMHQLVHTGRCSSSGLPVKHCPSNEGLYIGLLLFGIFGMFAGATVASSMIGTLLSLGLLAWGLGPLVVGFDASASSGSRTFGFIFGAVFTVLGLLALGAAIRSELRKRRAGPGGVGGVGLPSR
jgi:hypothetical protein